MSDEVKKEAPTEPVVPPTYRDRINGILAKVSKGEVVFPKAPEPTTIPENPTYKKMKELGGLQKGLPELFKIEESAFDVPHYVDDEEDTQIIGTKLFKVSPPSSHPDVDEYWVRILPHLKRIGKVSPHQHIKPGIVELEVVDSKGSPETLRISLARDEDSGDKPTLVFEFENRDDLSHEEVMKFIQQAGLKADRFSAKNVRGIVVLDVLDK